MCCCREFNGHGPGSSLVGERGVVMTSVRPLGDSYSTQDGQVDYTICTGEPNKTIHAYNYEFSRDAARDKSAVQYSKRDFEIRAQ
jgi:hypothetical protein